MQRFGVAIVIGLHFSDLFIGPDFEEPSEAFVAPEDVLVVVIDLEGALGPVGSAEPVDGVLDCVFVGGGWDPLLS